MKTLLYSLIFLVTSLPVFGQSTQIILTSIERTDRTFDKNDELLLENNVTKHQITYTFDTTSQLLKTHQYLVETYFNIWDGDTIVEEKRKTKHKKWTHQVSATGFEHLLTSLKTDIDTLEKDMAYLHTSHHYLTIYIEVVQRTDTTRYYKTKPFGWLTPWSSKKHGAVLNPAIDQQIVSMMPKKFIGREKLILVPTKP